MIVLRVNIRRIACAVTGFIVFAVLGGVFNYEFPDNVWLRDFPAYCFGVASTYFWQHKWDK